MVNTNYLHEIECVDLVHHIHEFNDTNEIEKTIKFLKKFIPLFIFCGLYPCEEKWQKKGANKFPHHNIICGITSSKGRVKAYSEAE